MGLNICWLSGCIGELINLYLHCTCKFAKAVYTIVIHILLDILDHEWWILQKQFENTVSKECILSNDSELCIIKLDHIIRIPLSINKIILFPSWNKYKIKA